MKGPSSILSDLLFRIRALFRLETVERELDEELRLHIEHAVEKQVRMGLPRAEAIRQARLSLGGVEQVKELCREARGVSLVETALRDVRYSLRTMWRSPGFAAASILSLALGIGANTAVFTLIDAVTLRPLAVRAPAELVAVGDRHGQRLCGKAHPWWTCFRIRCTNAFANGITSSADCSRPDAPGASRWQPKWAAPRRRNPRAAGVGQLLRRARALCVHGRSPLGRPGGQRGREPGCRPQPRFLGETLQQRSWSRGTTDQAELLSIHHRWCRSARFRWRGRWKSGRRLDSDLAAAVAAGRHVQARQPRIELAARAGPPCTWDFALEGPRRTDGPHTADAHGIRWTESVVESGRRDPCAADTRSVRRQRVLLGAQERRTAALHAHGGRGSGAPAIACANIANLLLARAMARRKEIRCGWPSVQAAGG